MKKIILSAFTCLSILSTFAQDGIKLADAKNMADSLKAGFWEKRDTKFSVDLAFANFNDTWISNKGGTRNTAIGLLFVNRAVFHKNKGTWSNNMKFQYGSMKSKDQGGTYRKNLDLILLDTKYARVLSKQLNWFVGANFLSQLAPDYLYDKTTFIRGKKISALFAPGYLSEGVGIEWKPKPYFVLQFGGATLRQTFVTDNAVFTNKFDSGKGTSYGVPKGKTILNELGFNIVADFKKEIAKNVSLGARYQGFKAYAPNAKPLDHFFSADLTGKINKYLGVRGSLILMQDKDIADGWLSSYGGGIGLVVSL